jgi:chemotaxis protein methyltransferase CheR
MSQEASTLEGIALSDAEFRQFQEFFQERIGLHLSDHKKQLLVGRFGKRLRELGLVSFRAYFERLRNGPDPRELETAIGLITTHETHFFRESHHFDLLQGPICNSKNVREDLRVWSAACSTGEEPWTIAMCLHQRLGPGGWNLVASDVSNDVVAQASAGLYPMDRASEIPPHFLKAYCLKGKDRFEGKLLIDRILRDKVEFRQANLMDIPPDMNGYDVVFLRNVIIYFDAPTKLQVLTEIVRRLRPGGWLLLGHSESLAGMDLPLTQIKPSVHRKT